ncbi:MAG: peptidylprolyl isomerase [Myxococcota bacterium]
MVHFLVLGLALLALDLGLHGQPSGAPSGGEATVVVPAAVATLAGQETQVRLGRSATAEELAAAQARYVREEVLVREARAMGLHRDDLIVRRRLVQKMEFLLEEMVTVPEPTDAQLNTWRETHLARYRQPAQLQIEHRFFSRDQGRTDPRRDAQAALEDPTALASAGDPWPLPTAPDAWFTQQTLTGRFGAAFAQAAAEAPLQTWTGPVTSSFGIHLLRVKARRQAHTPAMEELRPQLRRDWRNHALEQALEVRIQALTAQYTIVQPPPSQEVP